MRIFEEIEIKGLKLKNRVVMAPMCMYSSDDSGFVQDFHRVHYGSRAMGGTGLIIQEATAVTRAGRISANDLGIWSDEQIPGLSELTALVHEQGAQAGIQLAHAGRKCESPNDIPVAPGGFEFNDDYRIPHELTMAEIKEIIDAFGLAAARADAAGYDLIEIHGAHGYLIHQFLSPLSNRRNDAYGGSSSNRLRFLLETAASVKKNWPQNKPLALRLSASDFLAGGLTVDDTIEIVKALKPYIDIFHLSSGGLLPASLRTYPGYQVSFAEIIRQSCQVPVIAVGLITTIEQAEEIVGNQRADLVALGRELLRHPNWPLDSQMKLYGKGNFPVPEQYRRAWK